MDGIWLRLMRSRKAGPVLGFIVGAALIAILVWLEEEKERPGDGG